MTRDQRSEKAGREAADGESSGQGKQRTEKAAGRESNGRGKLRTEKAAGRESGGQGKQRTEKLADRKAAAMALAGRKPDGISEDMLSGRIRYEE